MAFVKTPSAVQVRAPGHGGPLSGLRGLIGLQAFDWRGGFGNYPSFAGGLGTTVCDELGNCSDFPSDTMTLPPLTPVDTTIPITELPNQIIPENTIGLPSGQAVSVNLSNGTSLNSNGVLTDSNGNVIATGISLPAAQTAGMTPAQISASLTALANSAVAAYKSTLSPSVVPGSNLVYNPATGQFLPAITGTSVGLATANSASLSALFSNPTLLLLIAGVVVVVMMEQGKR